LRLAALAVGSALVLWATDAAAQTPEVWLGTWKLDIAKSQFSPGPPPRSQVVRNVSTNGDGFTSTTDMVRTDGKAFHTEYFARPDGKEYPFTGVADETISLTLVDGRDATWVVRKGGRVFMEGRTTYSRDGKTRTQVHARVDAKGQKHETTLVFERE
jgi:hypothetical protein